MAAVSVAMLVVKMAESKVVSLAERKVAKTADLTVDYSVVPMAVKKVDC